MTFSIPELTTVRKNGDERPLANGNSMQCDPKRARAVPTTCGADRTRTKPRAKNVHDRTVTGVPTGVPHVPSPNRENSARCTSPLDSRKNAIDTLWIFQSDPYSYREPSIEINRIEFLSWDVRSVRVHVNPIHGVQRRRAETMFRIFVL